MADRVTIFEVGPRDGLQNEKIFVPTEQKIALIDRLSKVGFKKIEAVSFVSPKWVPQMADGRDVMVGIAREDSVKYAALTPNMMGYERAKTARVDEIAIFGSASEGFSLMNINCSIEESLDRFRPVVERALAEGIPVRGYISVVTDCPYDGEVPPGQVAKVAKALFDMGCYEISLSDTIGYGKPKRVGAMFDAVMEHVPAEKLAGHFHDTAGRALENIQVSLERGIRTFDSAIAGLGGCPYAPGAKGNVDTILVHDRLTALGFETGLDRDLLVEAGAYLQTIMAELADA